MARKGRTDRGLMQRKNAQDKLVWYVRLYHGGNERRFGAFPNKTKAREFYEKAKLEQKEGRFFPERYQQGGYETVATVIDQYLETAKTKKAYKDEQFFGRWRKAWFKDQRLNAITPQRIEEARQELLRQGRAPGRINRYHAWLRHVLNVAVRNGKLLSKPATKLTMLSEPEGAHSLFESRRRSEPDSGFGACVWTFCSICDLDWLATNGAVPVGMEGC